MILSASRRTDIPCYYSDWFLNRIKAEYVVTRNPMNQSQISKIILTPEERSALARFIVCVAKANC